MSFRYKSWKVKPYYRVEVCGDWVQVFSDSANAKGRPLSVFFSSDGYPKVKLRNGGMLLHHIVAKHFLGPRPARLLVNHKDGNKQNATPRNLEYVTPKRNIQHSIENGWHVASDPRRMPTYKDGRCKNLAEYKAAWYRKNRRRISRDGKIKYACSKN